MRQGLEQVAQVEAVALFAHRAEAAAPHFALTDQNAPQVAELVARLDGLPLAIELAASRAGVLPPGAMLERMDQRLPLLLTGPRDLLARQQTLRATIGWSYELLDKDTRMLLRRFAVLAGGSTVETAEAVCGADTDLGIDVLEGLTVLAESSLVQTSSGDEGDLRFGMLQTIREFGLERLEAEDDRATIERRHAEWFLRLAEESEPNLRGPQLGQWLASLQLEHENLRAALRWAIDGDEGEIGLRIVAALWRFWHLAGHLSEGRRWAHAVLALPSAAGRTVARAGPWRPRVAWPTGRTTCPRCAWPTRRRWPSAGSSATRRRWRRAPTTSPLPTAWCPARRARARCSSRAGRCSSGSATVSVWPTRCGPWRCWRASKAIRSPRSGRPTRACASIASSATRSGWWTRSRSRGGRPSSWGLEVARSSFLETLEGLAPVGYRTGVAIALDALAALEIRLGHPVKALRLAGAAEALKEAAGGQVPPEFAYPDPRPAARTALPRSASPRPGPRVGP